MYSKKKLIRNLILVIGILIILVILLVSLGDIKSIWNTITQEAKPLWLLATLGILLLYCFFNQASIVLLTKNKYKDISYLDLFCIAGSEYFFNGITPFSSGGQPFQAYALKQKNVKFSDSTSILLLNFLAYQIVMNVISLFSVIFFYSDLAKDVPNLSWLIFIGFSINLVVMVVLILLGTTKFMGKGIIKLFDLISKIKFLKKFLVPKRDGLVNYVSDMQKAFIEISKSKLAWTKAVITKIFSLLIYYSIPFFSFLSIGINLGWENFIYVSAVTSFALTLAVWVPTPGSSGGAELAFTTLFVSLTALKSGIKNPTEDPEVAKNLALSGMLIWRMFTYYLLMLIGFIFYLIFDKRNRKSEKKQELGNNQVEANTDINAVNKIVDKDFE